MRLEDRFREEIDSRWSLSEVGTGSVKPSAEGLRLSVLPTDKRRYSNAQISDYFWGHQGRLRFDFQWRPPLRMSVTARAEVDEGSADHLQGTAGFGFWNHPFSPDVRRLPRLPRAIWFFFGSPPHNLQLAYGVPGSGWKAATIDAAHWRALLLAPLALPAVLLMRVPGLYRRLWMPIQRTLRIAEHALDVTLLAERHSYDLEWRTEGARFAVDGQTVLETPFAPQGAAGFVAWLDNQYAIVTPQGRFGFGVLPLQRRQTLILEHILIESI
jgi:hypothetical protein